MTTRIRQPERVNVTYETPTISIYAGSIQEWATNYFPPLTVGSPQQQWNCSTVTLVSYTLRKSTHRLVDQIYDGSRIFHLSPSLVTEVAQESDYWTVTCDDLGIVAADRSEDDAWAAFEMEFASIWDHIAQEKNKHLTIDARRLKRAIRKHVTNIEKPS